MIVPPWGLFGCPLGAIFGRLGGLLGHLVAILSYWVLGALFGRLGPSRGPLRPFWVVVEPLVGQVGALLGWFYAIDWSWQFLTGRGAARAPGGR